MQEQGIADIQGRTPYDDPSSGPDFGSGSGVSGGIVTPGKSGGGTKKTTTSTKTTHRHEKHPKWPVPKPPKEPKPPKPPAPPKSPKPVKAFVQGNTKKPRQPKVHPLTTNPATTGSTVATSSTTPALPPPALPSVTIAGITSSERRTAKATPPHVAPHRHP